VALPAVGVASDASSCVLALKLKLFLLLTLIFDLLTSKQGHGLPVLWASLICKVLRIKLCHM